VAPEQPIPKPVAMTWARRSKRVFGIEIERCARCGGRLKVIASIEEPELIARILAHRRERGGGGGADGFGRGARAAAGVAVLSEADRRLLALSVQAPGDGRRCVRRGRRPRRGECGQHPLRRDARRPPLPS
jgi:hypothetical protein